MTDRNEQSNFDALVLLRLLSKIQACKNKYVAQNNIDSQSRELLDHMDSFHENINSIIQSEFNLMDSNDNDIQHDSHFIKTIYALIDHNISNASLTIADLCDAVHLERTQVYRKLRADIKMSPSELIRKKRMEHALILLQNQDLTIGEVAVKCGYLELSYFDKVFLKYFDKTPSAYRKLSLRKRLPLL